MKLKRIAEIPKKATTSPKSKDLVERSSGKEKFIERSKTLMKANYRWYLNIQKNFNLW